MKLYISNSTDKPISGGQLLPSSAFRHQLGGGSPLPWFLAAAGDEEEEEEEKMDMLWEDFNEELASVPPLCPLSPVINKGSALAMKEAAGWLGYDGDMIVVDLEKHGNGKHPRRPHPQDDGRVVRRRKWSLRLMLRLLKKLFLVKKSRNPRTAPAPI
ncbi:hypothetical protein SORBI_3005G073400 [Sorghum bicolor]|uniref:Uncharacterized protein n=1 Tax=Sorghum bicolor TaxID=4558 RepID=A0A1Z5RH53_SORBI|nr:hypothetical protein SORBI_3005G073400 [Sorghum bicolor]